MADKKLMTGYDLSDFDRDVVAYIGERLEGSEIEKFPKEAFYDPNALVESMMSEDYYGIQAVYPQGMEDPAKARDYLYDNMEEICTVLDMSDTQVSGKEERFAELVINDPRQAVLDVYAEEAKQLIAQTSFYFNQNIRQELADEQLSRTDVAQVCAALEGKDFKRDEDVVRFHGTENGKPFTAEYAYKKMNEKIELYFDRPDRLDVKKELYRIADKAALDFRVTGPRETFADFNLSMKALAQKFKGKDNDLFEDLEAWRRYVTKDLFRSDQAHGLESKPKPKVNLRMNSRQNDKEHTMDMVG